LLAAADPPAAADLLAADLLAAGLVAAADGAGLPDDVLADAKAAVGTAIAVAAMTAATARRRLRTDMTLSFADRMPAQSSGPAQDRPSGRLKET
jgi:hypothetical protein